MRVIIAGGRDYYLSSADYRFLASIRWRVFSVLSGGATGADRAGELWAIANRIPVTVYPADWPRYGRKAGPIRNALMTDNADAIVLFPGGRGTDDVAKQARNKGLFVWDRRKTA